MQHIRHQDTHPNEPRLRMTGNRGFRTAPLVRVRRCAVSYILT